MVNTYLLTYLLMSPAYIAELFSPFQNESVCTRQSYLKLTQPSRKTNLGKKTNSFFGPLLWNKLNNDIKQCKSLNTFKHKIKDFFLTKVKSAENNIVESEQFEILTSISKRGQQPKF